MAEIGEAELFRPENEHGQRSPAPDESRAVTPSDASSDERHKVENQVIYIFSIFLLAVLHHSLPGSLGRILANFAQKRLSQNPCMGLCCATPADANGPKAGLQK